MEEGTVRKNYINILEKVLRVRQACDHPYLVLLGTEVSWTKNFCGLKIFPEEQSKCGSASSESEIPKFGRCRFNEISWQRERSVQWLSSGNGWYIFSDWMWTQILQNCILNFLSIFSEFVILTTFSVLNHLQSLKKVKNSKLNAWNVTVT